MTIFAAALSFILGSIVGSFLSVVIYRLNKKDQSILFSRSICTTSGKVLKPIHMIPIFSYIFLRGRSAYSNKKISAHYILLEIITGLIFLAAFLHWNFITTIASSVDPSVLIYSINWKIFQIFFYHLIIFSFLIAIFFYDLLNQEIPDKLSIPAIAIAIIGGLLFGEPTILGMLIGAAILFGFFAFQFFLSKGTWIGGGDLRLGVLMGVILGWEKGLIALMATYIIGGLISAILLISKKVTRKTAIPFGPFLVTGTLLAVFYGDQIISWYLSLALV